MNDKQIKNILAVLLHDIGKVMFSKNSGKNHCESGYDFLKNDAGVTDSEILDTVRYHHYNQLLNAKISDDSLAYIGYIANRITSAYDAKEPDTPTDAPLESVFNILNGNNRKMYYKPQLLADESGVNFPQDERRCIDSSYYSTAKTQLLDCLGKIDFSKPDKRDITLLLETLETLFTYVPASSASESSADISLFEHLKMTCAVSSCILNYLNAVNISDYKTTLFDNLEEFYDSNVFLMYSLDVSGIQSFIYTINTEGALKTLRARSFYLEIFMETIIDELIERLNLSRANIIYSGGGHCYLILPNTVETMHIISDFEAEVNKWLIDNFRTGLYVAGGFTQCSANSLRDKPKGSYADIFAEMSREISKRKLTRYNIDDLITLNSSDKSDGLRECKVCRSLHNVNDSGRCDFCEQLIGFSKDIMDDKKPYLSVVKGGSRGIRLPFSLRLIADTKAELKKRIECDKSYVRSYGKNISSADRDTAVRVWVGSYQYSDQTAVLAAEAAGIDRIAVLRADVDNLGQSFVHGFDRDDSHSKLVNLSRTATLSKQLSLFFKKHINGFLSNGKFNIAGTDKVRKALVVYSGGDDVFIIGAWNDVISLAVDISNEFCRFTEGTLSISAGIGLFGASFPISVAAGIVETLEDASKNFPDSSNPEKNAVTLFDNNITYSWSVFENRVVNEKLRVLSDFFENTEDHGRSFLYNLLFYIKNCDDKINIARYVYLLSRMEPNSSEGYEKIKKYNDFSTKLYDWIKNPTDRDELTTAIYLYSYISRKVHREDK